MLPADSQSTGGFQLLIESNKAEYAPYEPVIVNYTFVNPTNDIVLLPQLFDVGE